MYWVRKKTLGFFSKKKKALLFCFSITAFSTATIREHKDSLHENMCHSSKSMDGDIVSSSIPQGDSSIPKNNKSPSSECTECAIAHFHRNCSCHVITADSRVGLQNLVDPGSEWMITQSLINSNYRAQLFRPPISISYFTSA